MAFKSVDELFEAHTSMFDGKWVDFPSVEGARVKIAHVGSAQRAISKAVEAFREEHEVQADETIPDELQAAEDDAILKAMFGTVVRDWEFPPRRDGTPFEFNEENYALMVGIGIEDDDRRRLAPLRVFVMVKGRQMQTFYDADEEAATKN